MRIELVIVCIALVLSGIESGGTTYAAGSAKTDARARTATVVPFRSIQDGQIIVPLYVDEAGPLQFLLDTGSSRSAISETLATRLSMPLVSQTKLVTSTGSTMRPVARLINIRVGRARAQAILAPTLSDDAVRRLGADVVGVLGQDFLSRFNYTIDYRHDRLIWHDEEASGDEARQAEDASSTARQVRLTLRPSEGRFLVDLPQGEGDGAPASFVPDSAADGFVLFGRATTNQLLAETSADRGRLVTLDGNRVGRLVVLKRVQVGVAALFNQPAIVIVEADRTPDAPEGDGLLPLSVFASVTFNNRDGYVLIEPR
jgi:predicted aspartyl protease